MIFPTLSVVIPTYNDPHRLRLCLDGIKRNRFKTIEVIVVNDGGESVESVVGEFAAPASTLYIRYRDLGQRAEAASTGQARNVGLQLARAARVLFLDQDCVPAHDVLSTHAKFGSSSVIVVGVRRHIDQARVATLTTEDTENLEELPWRRDSRFSDKWFATQCGTATKIHPAAVYGCHMSVPTELARHIGGHWDAFRGWGHQDVEFACRLGRVGCKMVVRHDLVVYHLDHDGQKTTNEIEETNCRLRDETYRDKNAIVRNGGPLEALT